MLKVTTTNQNQTITLKLEGKLAGPWVQEVTRVWVDTANPPEVAMSSICGPLLLSTAQGRRFWQRCRDMARS